MTQPMPQEEQKGQHQELKAYTSPLLVWTYCVDGALPDNPVEFGTVNNTPLYIARSWLGGYTHIGYISPGQKNMTFSHAGKQECFPDYQVLEYQRDAIGEEKAVDFEYAFTWFPCKGKCTKEQLGDNYPIEGGHDLELNQIIIGRGKVAGKTVVGECGETVDGLRACVDGQDVLLDEYEVLILNPEDETIQE
jgi:hypothetical protein